MMIMMIMVVMLPALLPSFFHLAFFSGVFFTSFFILLYSSSESENLSLYQGACICETAPPPVLRLRGLCPHSFIDSLFLPMNLDKDITTLVYRGNVHSMARWDWSENIASFGFPRNIRYNISVQLFVAAFDNQVQFLLPHLGDVIGWVE